MMIWITKHREQSKESIELCHRRNFDTCESPLLNIVEVTPNFDDYTDQVFTNADGYAATSMNALNYIAKYKGIDLNKPLICAGQRSRVYALQCGFKQVYCGNTPGITHMPDLIIEHHLKRLVYFHGTHTKHHFKDYTWQHLRQKQSSFLPTINEFCVYDAVPVQYIPQDIRDCMMKGEIKAITCFSERSIQTLLSLCEQHQISSHLSTITLLCMSEDIAFIAQKHGLINLIVAPSLSEMLEQLSMQ